MYKKVYFISFLTSLLTVSAQTRCQNEPNGSQLPLPNSRTSFLFCLNGAENIRNCPNGREFDPFDRRCMPVLTNSGVRSIPASRPQQDPCAIQPDGTYLPDSSNRNRFIICEGSSSQINDCNPGKTFNPSTLACELPNRPLPPLRIQNSTRGPLTYTRVASLRPAFANSRPTPRIVQQNIINQRLAVPFQTFKGIHKFSE